LGNITSLRLNRLTRSENFISFHCLYLDGGAATKMLTRVVLNNVCSMNLSMLGNIRWKGTSRKFYSGTPCNEPILHSSGSQRTLFQRRLLS
jgi:hypothetical protein